MSGHAGAPPADADAVGVPHGEPMDIRPDDLSPGGDAFTERWAPGTLHTFEVKAVLRDRVTPFQHLRVLDTVDLGRVMVLDVAVQVAERGEASYHELLVHPGLCRRGARRASDRRVLVIGGGDGGSAREALRHPDVAHVDLVDIDPEVTAAARDLLPTVWRRPDGAGPLDDDPRFHLHHADGLAFLAAAGEPYDLVVVDATDPVGPGRVLFSEPFYEAVKARLRPEGAVAVQAGSWFALPEALRLAHAGLSAVFPGPRSTSAGRRSTPGASGTWPSAPSATTPPTSTPTGPRPSPASSGTTPRSTGPPSPSPPRPAGSSTPIARADPPGDTGVSPPCVRHLCAQDPASLALFPARCANCAP